MRAAGSSASLLPPARPSGREPDSMQEAIEPGVRPEAVEQGVHPELHELRGALVIGPVEPLEGLVPLTQEGVSDREVEGRHVGFLRYPRPHIDHTYTLPRQTPGPARVGDAD